MADNIIKIVSYNSTGLGAVKMEYIKDLLSSNKVDILFLQETWLLPGNMDKLADIHSDYLYHGVSGIENNKLLMGRPYGGVAILWKKTLAKFVKKIWIQNTKRVCAINLTLLNKSMLLINCYMPVDNKRKSM